MDRRQFLKGSFAAGLAGMMAPRAQGQDCCGPAGAVAPPIVSGDRLKITDVKSFGVTVDAASDRPYVFVKIETDQGVVGWGEATLEGKAAGTMATVQDLRDFLIGQDPMPVEHLWQSIYVHSFYRAGPVLGSALSGVDQALWDIRGKVLGQPVWRLLGGRKADRLPAYASGGWAPAETIGEQLQSYISAGGFRSVKMRVGATAA